MHNKLFPIQQWTNDDVAMADADEACELWTVNLPSILHHHANKTPPHKSKPTTQTKDVPQLQTKQGQRPPQHHQQLTRHSRQHQQTKSLRLQADTLQ
jgi:hypothetical protein